MLLIWFHCQRLPLLNLTNNNHQYPILYCTLHYLVVLLVTIDKVLDCRALDLLDSSLSWFGPSRIYPRSTIQGKSLCLACFICLLFQAIHLYPWLMTPKRLKLKVFWYQNPCFIFPDVILYPFQILTNVRFKIFWRFLVKPLQLCFFSEDKAICHKLKFGNETHIC